MAAKTKKAGAKVAKSDASSFASFTTEIQKGVGRGIIEDIHNRDIEVIPTGMLGLDLATGVGGFPVGRIIELYGMESSGKSTVVYHFAANAQKLGYYPVMIETEGSLDRRYMRRIGMDTSPDRLTIMSPDNMEAAIDYIMLVARQGESFGIKPVILLDSVAALAPEVMMEDSAEKKYRATQAGVWSQQMPKLMHIMRRTNATLVMVNQMRDGMDIYSPPSTPGGRAIKFAASLRVLMRRKVDKAGKDEITGALGQEISFIVEKNKVSSPFRKGFAYLPAGKRVDLVQDVLSRGIERLVIMKDQKFEDGVLIKKVGYFTLMPTEEMERAIKKDIARAEKEGVTLPGTAEGPYLVEGKPVSVYRESKMLDVLDFAPNLVKAIQEEIINTLEVEAEMMDADDDPFARAILEAAAQFDADAEDGVTSEDHIAHATSEAQDDDEDDDLSEFDEK